MKNEMTVTFDFPENVNTSCRIVYYASAKKAGTVREAYAQITAGKGELKLPQGYPSIMYLFTSSGKTPEAIIYAERGDHIIIKGKNGDISSWEIEGNDATEALTSWRIKNKGLLDGDNDSKLNAAIAAYVKKNPDSDAAAIILYLYYVRRGHEEEFASLEATLGKKIHGNKKLMNALSAADLLTGNIEQPKYPSQIALAGEDGFADTLKLGDGRSSLLLIRGPKGDGDNFSTDSLKALLAAGKQKQIAELYSDTDSLGWRRHLTNDSIEGIKRLWMPLGVSDSITISMGVRRIPYYVVIDSKGKAAYRGDDFQTASGKFRSLNP